MDLASIVVETKELIGDLATKFIDPVDLTRAANWACGVVAQRKGLTLVLTEDPFTAAPVQGENAINTESFYTIEHVMQEGSMLAKADLAFVELRNPLWRETTKPARFWFWINGNTIGIDGVPSGSLSFWALERPTEMVNDSDTPDARLRDVNHMAIAYLAASHLLSLASSAQDIEKSRMLYQRGAEIAGIFEPGAK